VRCPICQREVSERGYWRHRASCVERHPQGPAPERPPGWVPVDAVRGWPRHPGGGYYTGGELEALRRGAPDPREGARCAGARYTSEGIGGLGDCRILYGSRSEG